MGEVYYVTRHWHRPLRIHHGLFGLVLIGAGILACLHDRHDHREWLTCR